MFVRKEFDENFAEISVPTFPVKLGKLIPHAEDQTIDHYVEVQRLIDNHASVNRYQMFIRCSSGVHQVFILCVHSAALLHFVRRRRRPAACCICQPRIAGDSAGRWSCQWHHTYTAWRQTKMH